MLFAIHLFKKKKKIGSLSKHELFCFSQCFVYLKWFHFSVHFVWIV